MIKKIYDIIMDYSSRGSLLDEDGIFAIIEAVQKEYELDNFIKDTVFLYDQDDGKKAFYNQNKSVISVYINRLSKYINTNYKDFSILDRNLLFTRIILHEVIHAKQYKMAFDETSFEGRLCQDCYKYFQASKLMHRRHQRIYNKNHDLFPIERLADIDSADICFDVAEDLNTEVDFRMLYLRFLIDGYYEPKEYYAPTENYAIVTNSKVLQKEDFYDYDRVQMVKNISDIYSLEEKLRFGLPTTLDEFELIRKLNN